MLMLTCAAGLQLQQENAMGSSGSRRSARDGRAQPARPPITARWWPTSTCSCGACVLQPRRGRRKGVRCPVAGETGMGPPLALLTVPHDLS